MKTELILIGKTNDKHFQAGIDDYTSRIGHYMPFAITVIPELKNTKALSEAQQKEREGEMVLSKLQPSDHVVLLDEQGKEFRSVEFARWIEQKNASVRRLVFVIGGPYGLRRKTPLYVVLSSLSVVLMAFLMPCIREQMRK